MKRPRIQLIDVNKAFRKHIESLNFNVTEGTFGTRFKARSERREKAVLTHKIPSLSEQDIVIINLEKPETLPSPEFKDEHDKAIREVVLFKPDGQTYFDPRPMVGSWSQDQISTVLNHGGMVITFAVPRYEETYHFYQRVEGVHHFKGEEGASSYDCLPIYCSASYIGKIIDTKVASLDPTFKALENLMLKYQSSFEPSVTLDYNSSNAVSLVEDKFGKALGTLNFYNGQKQVETMAFQDWGLVFILPYSSKASELVGDLLTQVLPTLRPDLFPELASSAWKDEEPYVLPKLASLYEKRDELKKEYKNKLGQVQRDIELEKGSHAFLYDILLPTGTDDQLVDAVDAFFEKLGYKNIQKPDEGKIANFQEDLQLLDFGDFVVCEIKGLSGYPTEKDCSQVLKYVTRTQKRERRTDVHGLFIVNHQRNQPPLKRDNPPFTKAQIADAKDSEAYSLVTTWQLFNAYLALGRGELTLEDIRHSLTRCGLVYFVPEGWHSVGEVEHYYPQAKAARIRLSAGPLEIGDTVGLRIENIYFTQKVTSIQRDKKDIERGDIGETFGIGVERDVKKGMTLYVVR